MVCTHNKRRGCHCGLIAKKKLKLVFSFSDSFEKSSEQILTMNLDYMRSCPNPKHLFPETVRKPLKNLVSGVCPRTSSATRVSALEFRASNADHRQSVSDMGITIVYNNMGDGKVQLMHSFYNVN